MNDIVNLTLRLPSEMHAYLVLWGEQDRRSLHNLLIWIIAQAIAKDQKGDT